MHYRGSSLFFLASRGAAIYKNTHKIRRVLQDGQRAPQSDAFIFKGLRGSLSAAIICIKANSHGLKDIQSFALAEKISLI